MSAEIAWKQNILITDFHLLKSLLKLSLDLVRRHSSVDLADKTLTVYLINFLKALKSVYHCCSSTSSVLQRISSIWLEARLILRLSTL